MARLNKIMNVEIKKYQGRIYYLEERFDAYGNIKTPSVEPADWITDTTCYDHCSFELHHMIKFTHYEQNKKWYQEHGLENCLILIRKKMHQHLENPIHELPNEVFYNTYKINKWELVFDKDNYFNDCYPLQLSLKTKSELDYDGCFDSLYDECQRAESVG